MKGKWVRERVGGWCKKDVLVPIHEVWVHVSVSEDRLQDSINGLRINLGGVLGFLFKVVHTFCLNVLPDERLSWSLRSKMIDWTFLPLRCEEWVLIALVVWVVWCLLSPVLSWYFLFFFLSSSQTHGRSSIMMSWGRRSLQTWVDLPRIWFDIDNPNEERREETYWSLVWSLTSILRSNLDRSFNRSFRLIISVVDDSLAYDW